MTDDSVSRYFEFYRVNLNGEKNTEWFLGSNLQCCLHATVLLAVKYSAELNKYIVLVRVICEKYWFRGQEKFPSSLKRLGKFDSSLDRIKANFNISNQQNVFITAGNIHLFEESCSQTKHSYVYKSKTCYNGTGFWPLLELFCFIVGLLWRQLWNWKRLLFALYLWKWS
jgi:hypothetical protein